MKNIVISKHNNFNQLLVVMSYRRSRKDLKFCKLIKYSKYMLSSFNLNRTKCFVYFDEKDEDIANKYKEAGIEVVCLTKKEAVTDPVEQIEKVKVAPKKKTSKKK